MDAPAGSEAPASPASTSANSNNTNSFPEKDDDGPSRRERRKALADTAEKLLRTVFVGNIPVACCSSRPLQKEFKRIFPTGSVESIRFRSIAFDVPQARKAAFINQKFRTGTDSCNAYVVMKSREMAEKAIAELNATVFNEKHLRLDFATAPKNQPKGNSVNTDGAAPVTPAFNTKKSIFLGNLDLEIKEEPIWRFFGENCGDVTNVRLIRDRSNNLGKGIGYVTFASKDSIPMALNMDGRMLEGRAVRIRPCCKPGMVEKKKERHQAMQQLKEQRRAVAKPSKEVDEKKTNNYGHNSVKPKLGAPKAVTANPYAASAEANHLQEEIQSKFGKLFEKRQQKKFPFSEAIEAIKGGSKSKGPEKATKTLTEGKPDRPEASSRKLKVSVVKSKGDARPFTKPADGKPFDKKKKPADGKSFDKKLPTHKPKSFGGKDSASFKKKRDNFTKPTDGKPFDKTKLPIHKPKSFPVKDSASFKKKNDNVPAKKHADSHAHGSVKRSATFSSTKHSIKKPKV